MRDEKSKNKIKKMLKVTKSANKSVLEDAVDGDNTAGSMTGQDDYGYVSTEANAFYAKYIEKVKDVKEDKGFAPSRPQSLKDLSGTKERVKAALTREIEEKKSHKGQRTSSITSTASTSTSNSSSNKEPSIVRPHSSSSSKTLYDPEAERLEEERKKREEEQQRRKNRKPLPPPMDFQALLKLAEQKQHEPIEILPVVKKEPERLLTLKEKMELEERQRAREARERREREQKKERITGASNSKERRENDPTGSSVPTTRTEPNGRIPKLNQAYKSSSSTTIASSSTKPAGASIKCAITSTNGIKKPTLTASPSTSTSASLSSQKPSSAKQINSIASKSMPSTATNTSKASSSVTGSSNINSTSGSSKKLYNNLSNKNSYNGASREFPPRDTTSVKPRQFPPTDVQKTRQLPHDMQKLRQFPPPDMQRSRGKDIKKPPPNKRLRIEDDDSEYDSEMDDFIDDGDEEEDYSSHIRAIFGYDKQKYRDLDDEDDAAMESNFAQVQREEYISKKIGIQEDLEDMKLEAMEKQRKMMAAKQRKHK
ncbi:protein SPT2 homolog isoform X2 [Eurosta solidaginis]